MTKQYDVGYGKPPIKHQFQKGKSGNPRGRRKLFRPKPPLDFRDNLIAELKSPITIIDGGKKKKISKLEALMKSVVADGLKGNKTTTKLLLNFLEKQPKYAFEGDEVAYVVTKKQLEAREENLNEILKMLNELDELDSNQEQGNGSPASAAGSGSAPTDV